jgi:ArsR family transcriptional regulator
MKLLEIYRCLCDETRLRILHLLAQGPLCVCHFQTLLGVPQVGISKHLAYLRARGLVLAQRHEQWMIYRLPEQRPHELHLQLQCLQDCVQTDPVFKSDLRRLKTLRRDCGWIAAVTPANAKRQRGKGRPAACCEP